MRASWALVPPLLGGSLALAVWQALSSAATAVPNRFAFNWDSARRAMLDVGAADALRKHDAWRFLVDVVGPETWPTLRLAVAAPLHVAAGPSSALAVEIGLSIAFTAALFLCLGFAARQIAGEPRDGLLVFLVSAATLLAARALYVHAANGMLEVPSALLTLAASGAWLASRERRDDSPWAVALLGNLLFHVRWQHGLIFAAGVLLTEAGSVSGPAAARALAAALLRYGRTIPGAGLLCSAVLLGAACAWVRASGGRDGSVLGTPLSLALFAYVELALWRDRKPLAAALPQRVRFLWVWLLSPMVAWLLVPFTWRIRTLAFISAYDMNKPPEGLLGRLSFYPQALWECWSPQAARWMVVTLLALTGWAAWRSVAVRRRMLPLATVVGLELLALVLLSRRNYQGRFVLNLIPLFALGASAWIPAVPRGGLRTVLALGAAGALLVAVWPTWHRPELMATLSEGFLDSETGEACRAVAEALPLDDGVLLNDTSLTHRQACAMWVTFLARERGADVDVRALRPRGGWKAALVLSEGCEGLKVPDGLVADGAEFQSGPLCGRRYRSGPLR
jgi:hypothetical protein